MEQRITFNTKDRPEFIKELRSRVNSYFKENNITKYANANMVIKTIFMLSLYFVPFVLILTNISDNPWVVLGLWIVMGLGMAGIGLSIMHDANHGAYSKNHKVNQYLGYLINLVGGSAINWKIQHNVLHHSFTNIDGHDEDIDTGNLMRFSFHQKRYKIHRLQQFYAWFLYGLLTISWSIKKDFIQLERYKEKDLIKTQGTTYSKALTRLIFSKLFYAAYILGLPILLSSQAWWLTLIFYFIMHFVCSFTLSTIFQAAHVVSETSFPQPDETGMMDNNWAIHQLNTTSNFAKYNRPLSWFVGGLNFQIEHHLFPNICHVHYRNISKIVKKTAQDFNLPYYNHSTFFGALMSHAQFLTKLGKYDTPAVA
ncbi:MAG: acyl-CoA desaturase [Flavobacteriales bacterium]|nr:acyl-CoA desaturase [Flavobacteriales bacterium]